jgi:hypothetical protein
MDGRYISLPVPPVADSWTRTFTPVKRTGDPSEPPLDSNVIGQQHSMVQGGALNFGRKGPGWEGWGA